MTQVGRPGLEVIKNEYNKNKDQWFTACGHVSASSQSLHFILSLRLYLSFISSRPGLGSSSEESRSHLNSSVHFKTVENFGLLSPYISAMRQWSSLAFAPALMRNFMTTLNLIV